MRPDELTLAHHGVGLPRVHGAEKDPEQTAVHCRQWPSSFVERSHKAEEFVQRQTVVTVVRRSFVSQAVKLFSVSQN